MAGPGGGSRGSRRGGGSRGSSRNRHYRRRFGTRHYEHNTTYSPGLKNVAIIMFIVTLIITFVPSIIGFLQDIRWETGEKKLQDYANTQYAAIFANSAAYENNILFLYVVHDNYKDLDAIAWAGDDVPYKTNLMLSGKAISRHINNSYYTYQLSSGISMSISSICKNVDESTMNIPDRTYKTYNKSSLNVTTTNIDQSLKEFSDKTGHSVAVVIVDYEDVYGNPINWGVLLLVVVVGGAALIFIIRRTKQQEAEYAAQNPDDAVFH